MLPICKNRIRAVFCPCGGRPTRVYDLFSGYFFTALLLAVLVTCGCQTIPGTAQNRSTVSSIGIPPIPEPVRRSVARYQNWRFASLQDWGPAGNGMVLLCRVTETNQVHVVSGPGSVMRQLTFFSEPVMSVSVCPDPRSRTILFTRDSGGNENFQIFAMNLDSLRPVRLTKGDWQNDGMVWSNTGDRFAFHSNSRNGSDFDIYISDIRDHAEAVRVVSRGGSWSAHDWSPDDSLLLVSNYVSRTASYVYICNVKTGSLTPLFGTKDTVSQESAAWGPEGKGVFLTSDQNTDFRSLRYFDCETKKETVLTAEIRWDVREIALSKDRGMLAFMTNENGFSHVYIMNTRTFVFRKIPHLPLGGIYGLKFHPSGAFLGMTITTPQRPEDAYAVRLADFSLERWTKSGLGGLDTGHLVSPQLVRYPTFDSVAGRPRTVPCFVYKPPGRKGPFPVLITIHGGPESQFWPYFSPDIQYRVCELGLCVLAPNVRGSGGYGKEYLSLDNGYKREDAVRDIGGLLDWIEGQPDLDTARVGVSGGSYGGYLALASMARYNTRIKTGIDLYGIGNFITFLEHTAGYRRDLRRAEYGDERDPAMRDFLVKISPFTNASRITSPLLIIQGANDPRVPLEESQQIARAVRANKGAVWMLVAGDEGHGFRRKSNRDHQECVEALFLKTFLCR